MAEVVRGGGAEGAAAEPYPFRAVIFDMDGVIVDTEWFYWHQLIEYAEYLGIDAPYEDLSGQVGQTYEHTCRLLERWQVRAGRDPGSPQAAFDRYLEWAIDHPCLYGELLNPGVAETLGELSQRGVKCALASSSSMVEIEAMLCDCELRDAFEVIVSGEQFRESKPNPEIYLHTLERLGLPAGECCCVEDSLPGIAAGKAAGLFVVAKREERFGFEQRGYDLIIDQIPELLELDGAAVRAAGVHEE